MDVRVFHRSIYSPAMRFSLPAIAVDKEELEKIQSKIIPTKVQRLGFSSKMPTAIRYGPISMGGLGLLDLRTECGIEMIKYFRNKVYSNRKVGQRMCLRVQASQLESGLPNPILEEPTLYIPYLTPTWILSMQQIVLNHNMRITLSTTYTATLIGQHDTYIMDLTRLQGYSTRQQQDLNLVCIYLQVTILAELMDAHDRAKIAEWALLAQRQSTFVAKPACWPRQEHLTVQQRRLWKKYITSQFLRYDQI
jgi:hypothetical protein